MYQYIKLYNIIKNYNCKKKKFLHIIIICNILYT